MRIIAGRLGGRHFASPRGRRTHPMSDKVRGGLFNALGDIGGLSLLDAFAGSGALGYEAASRGAGHVLAIDSDPRAQRAISDNLVSLGLAGQIKLIKASAGAWLSAADEYFDIVICDPPYDDLQTKLLERLAGRTKPGGLAVLSLPPAAGFKLTDGYELLSTKDYGDARLVFYRRRG